MTNEERLTKIAGIKHGTQYFYIWMLKEKFFVYSEEFDETSPVARYRVYAANIFFNFSEAQALVDKFNDALIYGRVQ